MNHEPYTSINDHQLGSIRIHQRNRRSIHTNYNAKFKCDSLKAAVLKNQWLANRFGFSDFNSEDKKFPIEFKYEKCTKSS
jgi:hypothetical protein